MQTSPASRPRRFFLRGGWVVAALFLFSALATARTLASDAPVYGLIVQLRDAPSHVALARERALATGGSTAPALEDRRWQAVLTHLRADAALARELPRGVQIARRDPVGASAQVLRFETPLSTTQAAQAMQRLAERPEVLWVVPNVRERRQGGATNPPNDYYFALGLTGQWWLRDAGSGGNASAIEMRLRGVPGFQSAWITESGSAGAVVAVLDTGITCHPDLGNVAGPKCIGGRILPGYDFVADSGYGNDLDPGRDNDPQDPGDWVSAADKASDPTRYRDCDVEDSSWHGTINAGLVAALTDNSQGVSGINWNGRVVPVRVAGKCGAEVADIVDGMRWAAGLQVCKTSNGAGGCSEFVPTNTNPARILNISFGGSAACGSAYQQAIDELRALPNGGAVVVAAAGNEHGAVSRPASCQNAVGVAALNRDGFKSNYSNFGASIAIATVGGDDVDSGARWNTLADSGLLGIGNLGLTGPGDCAAAGASCYFYNWGTSFSAPVVSGAISLMLSVRPDLTADQIVQGLRRSARPHVVSSVAGVAACSNTNPGRCLCTTTTCGAGILDAKRALDYAANPATYVATPLTTQDINTVELRNAAALGPDRPANPAPPTPPSNSGGGGGVTSVAWLAGLLLASAALALNSRRARAVNSRRARRRCRPG